MKTVETLINRVIIVKIQPEEDIIDSIIEIVRKYNIKSGLINIIGALKKTTIGYFDIKKKEYEFNTIKENVELVSCMGNIAFKNGEPIVHLHAIVGKEDYSLIGGHLGQPSIISITGEAYIYETNIKIERLHNEEYKVSLLNI